jgi:hypothetical protein
MSDRLNRAEFVIQKYRLSEQTFIESEQNGQKLGQGKLMADETLQKFMEGDPSGSLKYLDWMLFQAGGGQNTMEKTLQLWDGDNATDPNSLRNQCRADFIAEWTRGFVDDKGLRHAPVSKAEAETAWKSWEKRGKFEFVMGDQDVALEDGFGFYRHWPGKDGQYLKIVNAVKLWHMAQPKLLAQNQRYARFLHLRAQPVSSYGDDTAFMQKCMETVPPTKVVLDLYAGWKPKEYSQSTAVYKTLDDLLHCLADVRKLQILRDIRFEQIYEDCAVKAVCPLTIGASIKFGIGKWCVCNRSEFDRSFEVNTSTTEGNWQRYSKTGPLVFLSWKRPMPAWLHKIAIHINKDKLRYLTGRWDDVNWIDCQNQQTATSYHDILERIRNENMAGIVRLKRLQGQDPPLDPLGPSGSAESFYQWGGREPGPAWKDIETGHSVIGSLTKVLAAIQLWAPTFKHDRIVLDYTTDITVGV